MEHLAQQLVQDRIEDPYLVRRLALSRRQRGTLTRDGRLLIVAIDHPARGTIAAGGDPWAMADRIALIKRVARVLAVPGVDGLLASPDLIEELLLYNHHAVVDDGADDFLTERVLIGSMNRAGLAGAVFELDDFVTAYTAAALHEWHFDGGKLLLRVDRDSALSSRTLGYCAQALNDLSAQGLPAFLEVLPMTPTTDELVRLLGIASALGTSTIGRWLKVPIVPEFSRVARATTCPLLLLGGSQPGTTASLLASVQQALDAAPNVRGLMMGRGILFPADGQDSVEVVEQLVHLVHPTT